MHKEEIKDVPNALPGRNNLEVEIYGMEGIPQEDRLVRERLKEGRYSYYNEVGVLKVSFCCWCGMVCLSVCLYVCVCVFVWRSVIMSLIQAAYTCGLRFTPQAAWLEHQLNNY